MLFVPAFSIQSPRCGSDASGLSGSPMSSCSTESLREVVRFLTFSFSITKYSHAEELQHPDGMMNSLNQPQDVIVSTRKALHLCLDWNWDYVRGNWICAVNKHSFCHLSLGSISVVKKDLSTIPVSKLMKLFQKALWKCITLPQKLPSWQLATILGCLFILHCQ